MAAPITDPMIRFMRRVDKTDSCWLWTGNVAGSRGRRPVFNPGTSAHGPKKYAYRWIYEQFCGPIPEGYEMDHLCRNRMCVRPDHLEPVTPAENKKRARLEVCRAGLHDLTSDENVRWDDQGRRRGCRVCFNTRARERRGRK